MRLSWGFAADAPRQLHVLWEDGDAPGVDRAQVGVLEERYSVRLGRLLQRQEGEGLEVHVVAFAPDAVGQLAYQALERPFADEQVGGLLVLADLAQSLRPRSASIYTRLRLPQILPPLPDFGST